MYADMRFSAKDLKDMPYQGSYYLDGIVEFWKGLGFSVGMFYEEHDGELYVVVRRAIKLSWKKELEAMSLHDRKMV